MPAEAVSRFITADRFAAYIGALLDNDRRVVLVVGSGASASAIPTLDGLLALADEYAQNYKGGGDFAAALQRIRAHNTGNSAHTYRDYHREFGKWVADNEFDVVAGEAVRRAYRAEGTRASLRGQWARIEDAAGEAFERDLTGWSIPAGLAALGKLISDRPHAFDNCVLTTNFSPLLEIAIRQAGGNAATLTADTTDAAVSEQQDADFIEVHHLHGFWRPNGGANRRLLTEPDVLLNPPAELREWVSQLIHGDTVLVIGHSGWDELLVQALREVHATRPIHLLWSVHTNDAAAAETFAASLAQRTGCTPEILLGVDSDRDLLALAEHLGSIPQPIVRSRHRFHHYDWERELISEQGAGPPNSCLDLLRQLDRRYHWIRSWTAGPRPASLKLMFWPVRLRDQRPSVIHMTQALAAAAVSARHVGVILCLDDYGSDDATREQFKRHVLDWFDIVPDSVPPEFVSLRDEVENMEALGDSQRESMLRPIHPWDVAREVLAERRPSILNVLIAAKVIPDIQPGTAMDRAGEIIDALERNSARRLLTPLTLWSYLHRRLLERRPTEVVTLGGAEEEAMWRLWHASFPDPVHHLYNPHIRSLTNESLMVRWSTPDELRSYLLDQMASGTAEQEGRYIHWLVHNAMFLHDYLVGSPPSQIAGRRLDTWAVVQQTLRDRPTETIQLIVDRVCAVYLR